MHNRIRARKSIASMQLASFTLCRFDESHTVRRIQIKCVICFWHVPQCNSIKCFFRLNAVNSDTKTGAIITRKKSLNLCTRLI